MIPKKEIEKLPVLPAKARGKDRWTGKIRMAGEVIVMDVYDARRIMAPEGMEKDAEIKFRWVCDKKNFYTYRFSSKAWTREGLYCAMHGYAGWTSSTGIKTDRESREAVEKFLEGHKETMRRYWHSDDAADQLMHLEENIRQKKNRRKWEQRQARIEARQKARKPLPKDWDKWLENHVFKDERYVFYDFRKRKQGNCACCGETVELDGAQKHNGSGKCPACGSRVQFKAVGRAGNVRDRKQAVYIQKTEGGILARYIMAEKYSSPEGEKYKSRDCVIDTWEEGKRWRDYCGVSCITGEEFWTDSRPADMSTWKARGYLYTRNIKQALKGTEFQYAPLAEWARHAGKEIPAGDFLAGYKKSPSLEYFIKAGLFRLTDEYVAGFTAFPWTGKNMQEILGIDRQRAGRLIKMDGGITALEWLKYEQESGIPVKDDLAGWLEENRIRPYDCRPILEELKSVNRMANYMKKQKTAPNKTAEIWRDYLRMAEQEGMDTTDDIVRMPRDLKARHDQLVDVATARRDAERMEKEKEKYSRLDAQIRENLPAAARYYWQNGDYAVIPAGRCEELIAEGRVLHHCVGSSDQYMEKMAKGESWILFLRKKEELEKPYYTIEINMENDEILQYYSEFDRQPDKEIISRLLNKFRQSVKQKRARIRVPAAAIT